METYDVILIGSGHNALVAAAYLTRSGRSVLILEQNDRPGGLVRTDELTLPGFKHDVYSAAHPLFLTGPAYADLGGALAERGLRYLNTDLPTGVSMEDGQTAVFPCALEAFVAEAERLAPGDGATLIRLLDSLNPYMNDVFALLSLDLTSSEAKEIIARLVHDGDRPGYSSFAASLFDTARTVVDSFQSPVLRAMLAPWVMHLGHTPDEIGSGIWVKLAILAVMGAGMPIPEGGSEMLARALAQLVVDQGGVIRTNTQVSRIIVEQGRASKVRTSNHEEFQARQAIVASTNPDQLYLSLLAESDVDASLRTQAKQYRYGRGCVQIHLALSEPPRWPDERFNRVGQPHLTDGLNGCTLAIAQSMAGLLPAKPTFTVDYPTNLDPSRAPEGKAIMRIQVLEVPCHPDGDAAGLIEVGNGTWTPDLTERFTERVIDLVSRHIPNIPSAIIGHTVITPDTLARFSPNQGPGDPYGGAHDLAQSYLFNPLPGQPGHATSVPNLFMLGAATWPGHGINGGSGYIVAHQILRTL
ncbi:phytoene desaturase family protein [Dictyobacter formicarum]|uniref:Pyridine nucleotide-disulfide oxidoreductase domain-containing protein 2 n=1 Tax=Dictyobacter formicarum TaxID=2778368 RepID=A0ABQ3VGK7_9CHLR|nr:NAD(P)/FAD-dependent oxidoreductase [Dictyobacter formicarum]GHO84915.1 FAD-dependent oxidoreductase [Dictyobacter formicarum]